jgi:hypothetical protein
MEIDVKQLTTCSIRDAGETISLGVLDQSGNEISLKFSFHHTQALSMTLPHLLSRALVAQTGDRNARFVFPLGGWTLEDPKDGRNVLLSLQTEDGFRVSFALTAEVCSLLGPALERSAVQGSAEVASDDDSRREIPQMN